MKNQKTMLTALTTLAIVVGVCVYFVRIHRLYDGAVDMSLSVWMVTLPVLGLIHTWQVFTGRAPEEPPQKLWQKVVTGVLLALFAGLVVYRLNNNLYDLPSILLAVVLLVGLMAMVAEKLHSRQKRRKGSLLLLVYLSGLYLLALGTVWGYLQVVQPVTVPQAEQIVAQRYGEDAYQFTGSFRYWGSREGTPLGRYYFLPRSGANNMALEVSVLDGAIIEVGSSPAGQ